MNNFINITGGAYAKHLSLSGQKEELKSQGKKTLQAFSPKALLKMAKSGMVVKGWYIILEAIGADPVDKQTGETKKQPIFTKILAGFILVCIFPAVPMIFVMYLMFKVINYASFVTKRL